MKIPPFVNILVLVVGSTLFYTFVGQTVPQKEVPAPEVIVISKDVSTEEMIEIGKGISKGKGICLTCHTLGRSGALRFPDLEGIGSRAASRIPGLSGLDYLVQSLYEPDLYVVEGFNPGMPAINKAPIGLTDDEILAVIAYLQSLGGTPGVTMETKHAYNGGTETEAAAMEVAAAEAPPVPGEGSGTGAATGLNGQALFLEYGCAECHPMDAPDAGTGEFSPSLHDVGERLDSAGILSGIIDPGIIPALPPPEVQQKKNAMEAAGVYTKATLQELQAIAEFLASRKGKE